MLKTMSLHCALFECLQVDEQDIVALCCFICLKLLCMQLLACSPVVLVSDTLQLLFPGNETMMTSHYVGSLRNSHCSAVVSVLQ